MPFPTKSYYFSDYEHKDFFVTDNNKYIEILISDNTRITDRSAVFSKYLWTSWAILRRPRPGFW